MTTTAMAPQAPQAPATGPATTLYQRRLMSHALGLSASHGQCVTRNLIWVAPGSQDAREIDRLARIGLMYRGTDSDDGREVAGHVTAAGAAELGVSLVRED